MNPDRPERGEEREFAARGARLHTSFAGFTFEAWGPASDGERLKAALASFTAPYGTTEQTSANGVGATASGGTGTNVADIGLIPAGEAVTSRYARTYDALICAAGFAHGHHGHGTSNANANDSGHTNGTGNADADTTTAADAGADLVGGADGAGGSTAATGGTTADGGCSQPPGTKAVINITVPLSALLGFGFAFKDKNETDANKANDADGVGNTRTPGANGSPPGSEPGAVPDPGGGTGTAVPGPAVPADSPAYVGAPGSPGSPGSAGAPGNPAFPGAPVSSGLAVTEDGNVLALSAVRAMAPTAQIRRLIFDDRTGLPLDLGRAHRLAPGYLRTAAFAGRTTCAWSGGCDVPVSQCEADHITEFTHGGETKAANLQPLCSTHNRLKYRRTNRSNGGAKGGSGAEGTGSDSVGTGWLSRARPCARTAVSGG